MKNIVKSLFALFVGALLFYFIVRETGFNAVLDAASLFLGIEGLMIIILTLLIVFIGVLRWRVILLSEGKDVSIILTARYLIKGFTVDYLTPFSLFGGEAVRVFLMEKEVGIKSSAFSSITDKIIDVTVHVFFLLSGILLFLFYTTNLNKGILFYAGAVIIIIIGVLFLFYLKIIQRKSFLKWVFSIFGISKKLLDGTENGKIIIEIEEKIIDFFHIKKKFFLETLFLSIFRHLLLAARIFLILFFITKSSNVLIALMVYGLIILSMMLPLPAAIGGMEAILALGLASLGFGAGVGVILALVVRGADLMVCLVGFVLFLRMSFSTFLGQFNVFLKRFGA